LELSRWARAVGGGATALTVFCPGMPVSRLSWSRWRMEGGARSGLVAFDRGDHWLTPSDAHFDCEGRRKGPYLAHVFSKWRAVGA